AYALIMPPEARHYDKPDFTNEEWTLTARDKLQLKATHFYPEAGKASNKWVIIAHGYGCTQENSYYLATHYLRQGFHVLTPDLRASGKSEGRYLTLGYRESVDVVDWAKRIALYYPEAKIILHGVSMGAATVMMACDDDDLPENVVACVEESGYTSAFDLLVHQIQESLGLPAFPAMNLLDWRCQQVAGFSLNRAVPEVAVMHSRVPLLFIHGTKDALVPPAMCEQLYRNAKAPDKMMLLIHDAVHGVACQKDEKLYFKTVREFTAPYMQ
ncbi:MAG: alpha/beta fold hydrolase, partial [Selenomonas sp.]|nr:alpha/beta fold hydrolase [Selenomonas sp.]